MFIPSGGSVLVDWGADVIKVEHPMTGDPQRALITSGLLPGGAGGVNFMMEQPNRGKRSIGLDLAHRRRARGAAEAGRDGRRLPHQLPAARCAASCSIDVDDIRARNPNIIIARGSGAGPEGPRRREGRLRRRRLLGPRRRRHDACPSSAGGWPPGQPTPAFGDVMGGLATAGAIAAALVKRERTGETSVVDVSLLATAMWQVSPMVIASKLFGFSKIPQGDRTGSPNPGVGTYRTRTTASSR